MMPLCLPGQRATCPPAPAGARPPRRRGPEVVGAVGRRQGSLPRVLVSFRGPVSSLLPEAALGWWGEGLGAFEISSLGTQTEL